VQNNANSIQAEIMQALFKATGKSLPIVGAGRTDSGVHAKGQIAHARLYEPLNVATDKIAKAINFYLPSDIKIQNAAIIPLNFHAVKDAVRREYNYYLHCGNHPLLGHFSTQMKFPFKEELLNKSAEIFLGEHDFTTFSKNNPETERYVCKVETCKWLKENEIQWKLIIIADRFVYGMVRALVGAMIDSARGKRSINDLKLSLSKKDRNLSSSLASPQGLVLNRVEYKFELFPSDRKTQ